MELHDLPPPPYHEVLRSTKVGELEDKNRTVTIRVRVKDIHEVNSAQGLVTINLTIHLFWTDPKLRNRPPETINWAHEWTPDVDIRNEFELTERTLYEISDTTTGAVRQKMTCIGRITNWMDLRYFPFDDNKIRILVGPKVLTTKELTFQLDNRMKQDEIIGSETAIGLVDFKIGLPQQRIIQQYRSSNNTYCPALELMIPIRRKYGFYISRIFLILYLMMAMSWSTFGLPVTDFGTRMNINLTLFLAAVAFLFVISENLPKLPYLTFLDKILVSTFIFLFLGVVENFIVYKIDNIEIAKLIDRWSFLAFPVALTAVTVYFVFKMRRHKSKLYPKPRFVKQENLFQGRKKD